MVKGASLNKNRIAKEVFAAAEAQGISDRDHIELLTRRVIKRLEAEQAARQVAQSGEFRPFPGMEQMVPGVLPPKKPVTIKFNVEEILQEIMQEMETSVREAEKDEEKESPAMKKTLMSPEIRESAKPEVRPCDSVAGEALKLNPNALHVLEIRYLQKDRDGNVIETPEEMFHRVAGAVAAAELKYSSEADAKVWEDEFYRMMTGMKFLPNSPTLMNAGRELGQLSACFVLPVEDSMESIFDAVKYTALIHQSGGGTGFSFSRLRPESDRVGSTGGVASGPVSFMKVFDAATDVIKQGGMRRGANMAILRVDHPDIVNFIEVKSDLTVLTNFNLSVALTDTFMEAVKTGTDYDLINPRTGQPQGSLNAGEIFKKIVDNAWTTGDPGVVFIDEINRGNPTPNLGDIESTNPCGEQPLLPYESCNLGSINLSKMLCEQGGRMVIDTDEMRRVIRYAVRFLDDVIDVNRYPMESIATMSRNSRKIGLGVMGFADMLIRMGISYKSEEGIRTGEQVMQLVNDESRLASAELAGERGVFPAFENSIYDNPDGIRLRNASCTTIAPTGTLSLIAGCSSGIEPLFALSYTRNILDGAQLVEVNPYFEEAARQGGFYSEELMRDLAAGEQLDDIAAVPEHLKQVFVTAHGITPPWHVKMQAAFQKHTDNAVSKTVNFPREATREDVAEVYRLSFEQGLKGVTIYRDGSREGQVLTTGKNGKAEAKAPEVSAKPRKRSKVTTGITEKVSTGCGNLYITVNSDETGICEVFSTLGKAGGCASSQLEGICRLISLALRAGQDVSAIVRQLRGIRCPSIAWEEGKSILSCADAIASVLDKHTTGYDGKPKAEDYGLARNLAGQCPDCATLLVYQEGCFICPGCGYTKC
jgi:ribonucleoside-diphosphate reductase alpha chain